MRSYSQPGDVLTLPAPYDVASGRGLKVGTIFGIAANSAKAGEIVETKLQGVFEIDKAEAQVWAQGDLIYWDNTARLATATAGSNAKIGVATSDTPGPFPTGRVRLNGTF